MTAQDSSIRPPSLLETAAPFWEMLHGSDDFHNPHISAREIRIIRGLNDALEGLGYLSRAHRLIAQSGIIYPKVPLPEDEISAEVMTDKSAFLLAILKQASLLKVRVAEVDIPEDAFWSLGFVFEAMGDLRTSVEDDDSLIRQIPADELAVFVPLSGISMIEPVTI